MQTSRSKASRPAVRPAVDPNTGPTLGLEGPAATPNERPADNRGTARSGEELSTGNVAIAAMAGRDPTVAQKDAAAPVEVKLFPGSPFRLNLVYPPAGDQPRAIEQLTEGIRDGLAFQTLLGVTGSGKTYTMANVIARIGRPALVLAPNKTLAAQLYAEMREFFPENAIEYFVSYYDYYQPEAYVPSRDLFIE